MLTIAINAVPAARKRVRELHGDGVRWSSPGSLLAPGFFRIVDYIRR